MTPELKAELRSLDLSQRAFAVIAGVGEDVVSGWGRQHHSRRAPQKEPRYAWLLVQAWKRYPDLLVEALHEESLRYAELNVRLEGS